MLRRGDCGAVDFTKSKYCERVRLDLVYAFINAISKSEKIRLFRAIVSFLSRKVWFGCLSSVMTVVKKTLKLFVFLSKCKYINLLTFLENVLCSNKVKLVNISK